MGIAARPAIVERRHRFGDWESDTVEGRKSGGRFLATPVERKSGYVCVAKLANNRAEVFTAGTIRGLREWPLSLRRTLPADNGVEFAHCKRLETA